MYAVLTGLNLRFKSRDWRARSESWPNSYVRLKILFVTQRRSVDASAYFILRCVSCCHIMTQPHLPPPNFSDALKGAKKLILPHIASGRGYGWRIPSLRGLQRHTDDLHCRQHSDNLQHILSMEGIRQLPASVQSSAVVRHKRPQRLQDGKEGHLIIDLFKKTPKPTTFCWVLPFIPLMFHLH